MFKNIFKLTLSVAKPTELGIPKCNFQTSSVTCAWGGYAKTCEKWKSYNEKVFPIQTEGEPKRAAYVCHVKENIKYSLKKMWYVSSLIRGMTIDEALKQLDFVNKKGALAVKETLLEAQEMAVRDHNVEFKSNLWVSESFCGKGIRIKGMRRHARGRVGTIIYGYVHYFVTLEEGKPPEHYYPHRRPKTSEELLAEWLDTMRKRKVYSSL